MSNRNPSPDLAAAFLDFKKSNRLPDVSIETLLDRFDLTQAQSEWLQEHTLSMLLAEFCATNDLPFVDAESLLMFHHITSENRDWLNNFVKSWDAMTTLHGSAEFGHVLKFGTAADIESGATVPAYFFDNGHCIVTNPRLSQDTRPVDPTSEYGLTGRQADLLLALNAARGVL